MIMATSLLLGACNPATDVNVKETGDKNLIGKSDIRIKDGRMTPEALWAMGRIGGMNVSPDGKKVVYTVAYYSVPENKSNREVFVMNADGSDNKQITKTRPYGSKEEPRSLSYVTRVVAASFGK